MSKHTMSGQQILAMPKHRTIRRQRISEELVEEIIVHVVLSAATIFVFLLLNFVTGA